MSEGRLEMSGTRGGGVAGSVPLRAVWVLFFVALVGCAIVAVVNGAWPFVAVLVPLAVVVFVVGWKFGVPVAAAGEGLAIEIEAAHAERAARRIVQHELLSPWNWAGVMPFVMITLGMLAWLSRSGFGFEGGANLLVWIWIAFSWSPVFLLSSGRKRMLSMASTRDILAEYSAASVRRSMALVNDHLRLTAFIVIAVCAQVIAYLWPESSPVGTAGEGFRRVLPIWAGLIAAVLVLVANVITTREGPSDEEVEDHRRKVLGEDWFAG